MGKYKKKFKKFREKFWEVRNELQSVRYENEKLKSEAYQWRGLGITASDERHALRAYIMKLKGVDTWTEDLIK